MKYDFSKKMQLHAVDISILTSSESSDQPRKQKANGRVNVSNHGSENPTVSKMKQNHQYSKSQTPTQTAASPSTYNNNPNSETSADTSSPISSQHRLAALVWWDLYWDCRSLPHDTSALPHGDAKGCNGHNLPLRWRWPVHCRLCLRGIQGRYQGCWNRGFEEGSGRARGKGMLGERVAWRNAGQKFKNNKKKKKLGSILWDFVFFPAFIIANGKMR